MKFLKRTLFSIFSILIMVFSVLFPSLGNTHLAAAQTPMGTILLPGEISQYQGMSLTPINTYIAYLKAHPDVAIKGTQFINQSTYQLALTGLVNNPLNFSYEDVVNGFNSTLQVATLPCVEGWSATLLWQGVPIVDLLNKAGGASSDANTVIFYASDGYSSSLPLDYIKQNNIMIAYKMNNVTLTPQTGWPFFLVANNQYGYKWVEWITEINVSNDSNYRGYWESRGYPNNATVSGGQGTGQSNAELAFLVVLVVVIFAVAVVYVGWRWRVRRRVEPKNQF